MKNETAFQRKLTKTCNAIPGVRIERFTDAVNRGAPDVLYCVEGFTGVIELKYLPKWPARKTSPVHVGSGGLSDHQRLWLLRWRGALGIGFVLLGIDREWFLFHPWEIPAENTLTRDQFRPLYADARWGTDLRDLPRVLKAHGLSSLV